MQIVYKKQAVKYINACDRTTKLRIKDGEDEPQLDEIQAIAQAKQDTSPTISHLEINWE